MLSISCRGHDTFQHASRSNAFVRMLLVYCLLSETWSNATLWRSLLGEVKFSNAVVNLNLHLGFTQRLLGYNVQGPISDSYVSYVPFSALPFHMLPCSLFRHYRGNKTNYFQGHISYHWCSLYKYTRMVPNSFSLTD